MKKRFTEPSNTNTSFSVDQASSDKPGPNLSENKIRVLIVDDHPFFRSGLSQWLSQQGGLLVCNEAGSLAATRSFLSTASPEVILMDLRLGDGAGLELIRELAPNHPETRIVALSQFDEDIYAHRALQAGARGYLMKSEATESVLAAINTVIAGGIYLSPMMSNKLLKNIFPDPVSGATDLAKLSDRELQVFELLGTGRNTAEVAGYLKISPKTVETYRENLKKKLRLPDSPALIRAATLLVENGRI